MKLSTKQIEVISKVFIDFGKIIFATVVVGNFLSESILTINYPVIIVGLVISSILIILGILILKGGNNQ